jgi:hypothetical protein
LFGVKIRRICLLNDPILRAFKNFLLVREVFPNMMTVSMGHQPVHFGAKKVTPKKPNYEKLKVLRDELVDLLPKGPLRYSNGSGLGLVGDSLKDNRVGIVIYTETNQNKAFLVNNLVGRKIIEPTNDGLYKFKGELVGFKVIGRVEAQ